MVRSLVRSRWPYRCSLSVFSLRCLNKAAGTVAGMVDSPYCDAHYLGTDVLLADGRVSTVAGTVKIHRTTARYVPRKKSRFGSLLGDFFLTWYGGWYGGVTIL